MDNEPRPYVLFVAEIIYSEIVKIKKDNIKLSTVNAVKNFIGSKIYKKISSGKFHDEWFDQLQKNKFIDDSTKKKVPEETLRLLKVQKDLVIKQLIQFPDLYYTENNFPLKVSQRAFEHLWRMCESYELWCNETKQYDLIYLDIINEKD